MIVLTKLWVDVQQGEDEGEFLIFLLSEETDEADEVVEQEWSQHRCSQLGVSGETTDSLVISIIGTEANWILPTLYIIITLTLIIIIMIYTTLRSPVSPVQFVDQIDVSESVEGWQYDVESQHDQY